MIELDAGIRGASHLSIYGTQPEVRHGSGGVQLKGALQQRLGFLRLIHGHQNLGQADAGFGVTRLQLYCSGVTVVRFLPVILPGGNVAKPALRLFVKRIELPGGLVFVFEPPAGFRGSLEN
jgi:hypothetical protein